MDVELRPIRDDEVETAIRAAGVAFGEVITDEAIERVRRLLPLERTLAAFDDGELVATAGDFPFQMAVPGGAGRVPTAGVTWVTVLPTHRRRGILRRLMQRQLDEVAARGEATAVLTASESSIYGRFGYGEASKVDFWTLKPKGVGLLREPQAPGRIRMASPARIREVAPAIYDAATAHIPGTIGKSADWWDIWVSDPEDQRGGAPAMHHAVHEAPGGEVDGFVSWRTVEKDDHGLADSELQLVDLYGNDPEVEAALFAFLLQFDLIGSITAGRRQPGEHLRWRLADPRRLVVDEQTDALYVRILDPAVALAQRRYRVLDDLVLEVSDPFRPATGGRWRVQGGPDGAECTRTDRTPDLALGITELGALFLGGVSATTLQRAGRVEELTAGAVGRADAFFGWGEHPWLTFGF